MSKSSPSSSFWQNVKLGAMLISGRFSICMFLFSSSFALFFLLSKCETGHYDNFGLFLSSDVRWRGSSTRSSLPRTCASPTSSTSWSRCTTATARASRWSGPPSSSSSTAMRWEFQPLYLVFVTRKFRGTNSGVKPGKRACPSFRTRSVKCESSRHEHARSHIRLLWNHGKNWFVIYIFFHLVQSFCFHLGTESPIPLSNIAHQLFKATLTESENGTG